MKRMKTPAFLMSIVALLTAAVDLARAEPPQTPGAPATIELAVDDGWFHWPAMPTWHLFDGLSKAPAPDHEFEPDGPWTHWFIPVELFTQGGAVFEVGGGRLSNILEVGVRFDFGAKNYCYDDDRLAAWTGDLGLTFEYNLTRGDDTRIQHHGVTDQLDYLFRQYVRVGIGREWYYTSDCLPEDWRLVFGVDLVGRIGTARAHFKSAPVRQFINVGINTVPLVTLNVTDIAEDVSFGAYAGVVVPWTFYDLIFGVRVDYEHEWISLIDNDKHLDAFVVLLSAAIRY
jgi:hypothetical protein